jgi:glycosyltransferase involved in cell wall biosynthesis
MADPALERARPQIAVIGPVFPYRAGIAYCTTALAAALENDADVEVISFRRQYPKRFYPGEADIDETLRSRTPPAARFALDILDPLTWIRTALELRKRAPDAVIFVWWIWVWALPYLAIIRLLRKRTRVILQCHNVSDKEPARWKSALTNAVLRRASAVVVHARSDEEEVRRRLGVGPGSGVRSEPTAAAQPRWPTRPPPLHSKRAAPEIIATFLPVHELGGSVPSRSEGRRRLGLPDGPLALFFGHVRPFKGLDLALRAWPLLKTPATLLVAGEAWWQSAEEYRHLARELALPFDDVPSLRERAASQAPASTAAARVLFEFRFIPDSEIADYFAACDVVVAPYRSEAQSGVAMTAFHFERPVIAAAVGGLPEIIDASNGLLVPPEDPTALARAVDAFFRASDRAALERGAAAAAARYSWSEYAATLRRLVDSGSKGSLISTNDTSS